jgi:hypothetical protein
MVDNISENSRDAFSIDEFCARNCISRSGFYNLLAHGIGPRVMRVGSRTLISKEAASDWRAARERAAKATS